MFFKRRLLKSLILENIGNEFRAVMKNAFSANFQ